MTLPATTLFTLILSFVSLPIWGHPSCEVQKRSSDKKLGIASGIANGFESGKIYVTLTNGSRKYTTVAENGGKWAISYADLDKKSEIFCWQEGTGLHAKSSWERN